jgi:hypothetical protein
MVRPLERRGTPGTILMAIESGSHPNRLLIALIVAAGGARVCMFLVTGYFLDDPFITYRYAENIVRGVGFVYNPAEHVLGTTTPLYTLMLAGLALVFGTGTIPLLSIVISIFADMTSVVLVWKILSRFDVAVRLIVCLLVALYPKTVLIGVSGMEASLVVLLMLLSYRLMNRESVVSAYAAFGALLLTRPDGIFWMVGVIVWFSYTLRKGGARAIPVTVAVLAPWIIFSWITFGSIIPHSVTAKRISWDHLYPAFDPVRVLIRYFPFEGFSTWSAAGQTLAVIVFLVPVVMSAAVLWRKKDPLAIFPLFFLGYSVFFSMAKVSTDMWYYLPGYVAYFVSSGSLLDWLRTRIARTHAGMYDAPLVYGTGTVMVVLLAFGMARWSQNPAEWFHRHFVDLGVWMRSHADPDDTVFLEGIGYVGWDSKMYISDAVGLVSPDVLAYRMQYPRSDSWYIRYIRDRKPDFVVLRHWEIARNRLFLGWGDGLFPHVADREWFLHEYQEVRWNERVQEDSVHFVVFRKR